MKIIQALAAVLACGVLAPSVTFGQVDSFEFEGQRIPVPRLRTGEVDDEAMIMLRDVEAIKRMPRFRSAEMAHIRSILAAGGIKANAYQLAELFEVLAYGIQARPSHLPPPDEFDVNHFDGMREDVLSRYFAKTTLPLTPEVRAELSKVRCKVRSGDSLTEIPRKSVRLGDLRRDYLAGKGRLNAE